MSVSQAGSFHSVWCPVLSAAVVCATGLPVSGSQRAVVPHSGLSVRDPHECKSVLQAHNVTIYTSTVLQCNFLLLYTLTSLHFRGEIL